MKTEPMLRHPQETLSEADLLAAMLRALVDQPQEVRVASQHKNDGTELCIYVHPSDRRLVIGRQGRMIMLLRQLFGVLAARQQRKITIEVMETEEERAIHRGPRTVG